MKYIKLFENFEQIEKYEFKDGNLDLNDKNKFCKLIDGPFLEKNPDWKNMPLIADDFYNSLLRIENVITGDKARCLLNEVVPITEEEWKLLQSEPQSEKNDKPSFDISSKGTAFNLR